jgi:hypothetical protein
MFLQRMVTVPGNTSIVAGSSGTHLIEGFPQFSGDGDHGAAGRLRPRGFHAVPNRAFTLGFPHPIGMFQGFPQPSAGRG